MSMGQRSTTPPAGVWPRRLWGGLGAVLTALVLACAVPASTAAIMLSARATSEMHEERTQRFTGSAEEVMLDWERADVDVSGSAGDEDAVRVRSTAVRLPEKPVARGTSGGMELRSRCGEDCRGPLRQYVSVPNTADVTLASSGGMSSISRLSGDVAVVAGTGEVLVSALSGDLEVHTVGAPVTGRKLSGDGVVVTAGSASLAFGELPDQADITAEDGDVEIELPAGTDAGSCAVEAETDGEVAVDLPETAAEGASREADADCELRLSSDGGDITVTAAGSSPSAG